MSHITIIESLFLYMFDRQPQFIPYSSWIKMFMKQRRNLKDEYGNMANQEMSLILEEELIIFKKEEDHPLDLTINSSKT